MDDAELIARFRVYAFDPDQDRHSRRMRAQMLRVAEVIDGAAEDGREKSLAMTALEEAMMWGNRAIARTPKTQKNGGE